jgi:glycosyltransferase involved in cell wall biosynthesis
VGGIVARKRTTGQHELFDEAWYRQQHPDTADYPGTAWRHFILHGDAEGRAPGPFFDPEFYRRTYLSLAEQPTTAAFAHYLRHGRSLGYLARQAEVPTEGSTMAIQAALTGRPHPIVLVGNDAQQAGSPRLLLAIAAELRRRGFDPVFLLLRGGPLLESYRRLGPTLILDEGWDVAGLGAGIPPSVAVIGSTCWAAPVLRELATEGPRLLLVHEMPAYLREHDLFEAVSEAGDAVVVATPSVAEQLGQAIGTAARITVTRPGLFAPAQPRGGRRTVGRLLSQWGADRAPLFIGAGYADHRKGFDLFLEAARMITRERPSAGFVWLGECDPTALEQAAAAQADGVALLLPGFREDALEWYRRSTVYLLTSRQDPGPTTVADAAREGVPFVGLQTDIGLRSLGSLLDGVGDFEPDLDALVARALHYADDDTAARRATRAEHIDRITSFGTYVDELLATVRSIGPLSEPSETPSSAALRARDAGRWVASTALDVWEKAASGAGSVAGRTQAISRRIASQGPISRRVTAVVTTGAIPDAAAGGALTDPVDVRRLQAPDRAWLAGVELLGFLPHPSDAHLGRPTADPDPRLVSAVELAGPFLGAFRQFDVDDPPAWAAAGRRPPRILNPVIRPRPLKVTALAPSPSAAVRRPVGVFVHVFHLDRAELLAERIALIPVPHRVYLSTDTAEKAARLDQWFPDATVRVFENRGRDIYPKLCGFADVYDEHDIVLHLHSKRPVKPGFREGWLEHILDRLLPSAEGTGAIVAALEEVPALGMVSPMPLPELKGTRSWGPNLPLAELVTWRHGWPPMPGNHELAFPVGSMFWARVDALRPLLELQLPLEYFTPEDGRRDGTLAHAVERLFGVSCGAAGLEQIFVETPGIAGRPARSTPEVAKWLGPRRAWA